MFPPGANTGSPQQLLHNPSHKKRTGNISSLQLRGWGYGGPFCSVLDSYKMVLGALLQPTKWYGHKPRPYKMVFLVNYLGFFYPQRFCYFHPKMVKHLHSCS